MCQREMTLEEWCAELPDFHLVNKQLRGLNEENERLRTQLAGRTYFHSDQAVELENVALRDKLKFSIQFVDPRLSGTIKLLERTLSTPSPQVAKIEAVLEAAKVWEKKVTPKSFDDLKTAVRNLRGDK